ncbi:type 1 glutamine amidotransferase [Celerinatantimonas sp. MCCC 1A17872]|uniref:type 1 glutamine amidotransferase n=1 Tax=Celerinatantimonas sp. MCCC 1A17872 TaxID=3177514 RepID=UPI0038C0BB51
MEKKSLLFLQCGTQEHGVSHLEQRFESYGLAVDHYWAYQNQFPESLSQYSGIFISGSPHGAYEDIPFINHLHTFLADAASQDIPMLGVCFGSQILASALCGRDQVFIRTPCEVAYKALPTTAACKQDLIAKDLTSSVSMFVWHNDEVKAGHPDMVILADSDVCANHIWRFRDQKIWGIQGHPEISREQALQWFEINRERLTTDGADIEALKRDAHDAPEAKTLLKNFADVCLA